MRRKKRVLAILAFSAIVGCSPQFTPATPSLPEPVTLQLYSTATTAPLVTRLASAYSSTQADLSIETRVVNHEAMVTRLLSGEKAYFVSNHLPGNSQLWAAPIAQDGLVIIVHPENGVSDLSSDQIRQIFQGFIRNWSELGGEDLPITLFSRDAESGTRLQFERLIMGQRRTSANAQLITSAEAALISVAETRGGIAYTMLSQHGNRVSALSIDGVLPTQNAIRQSRYPLRSTLFIIGPAEPEADLRAFVGWIQSFEGQAIVAERFVPLPG